MPKATSVQRFGRAGALRLFACHFSRIRLRRLKLANQGSPRQLRSILHGGRVQFLCHLRMTSCMPGLSIRDGRGVSEKPHPAHEAHPASKLRETLPMLSQDEPIECPLLPPLTQSPGERRRSRRQRTASALIEGTVRSLLCTVWGNSPTAAFSHGKRQMAGLGEMHGSRRAFHLAGKGCRVRSERPGDSRPSAGADADRRNAEVSSLSET